jgi:hypothetical protein
VCSLYNVLFFLNHFFAAAIYFSNSASKPCSAESLDKQLEEYMGPKAAEQGLDAELEKYMAAAKK